MQVEVWPLWTTEPALAEIIVQRRQLEDEALAAGAVDAAELGRWRASLNDSVAAQRFVACVNAVLESARRPIQRRHQRCCSDCARNSTKARTRTEC